jgi:nucleoid DNA-binding protein
MQKTNKSYAIASEEDLDKIKEAIEKSKEIVKALRLAATFERKPFEEMKMDTVGASQCVYEAFQVMTTAIERANELALSGFDETKIHDPRARQAKKIEIMQKKH